MVNARYVRYTSQGGGKKRGAQRHLPRTGKRLPVQLVYKHTWHQVNDSSQALTAHNTASSFDSSPRLRHRGFIARSFPSRPSVPCSLAGTLCALCPTRCPVSFFPWCFYLSLRLVICLGLSLALPLSGILSLRLSLPRLLHRPLSPSPCPCLF